MFTFGSALRMTLYGASHGPCVGVVVDGYPSGVAVSGVDFEAYLERRSGGGAFTTPRKERDCVAIKGGVYEGYSTGGPVVVEVANADTRSGDYALFRSWPRPGHADWVSGFKYGGYHDPRGGGFFSGRMTVGLVCAGVLAGKLLDGITVGCSVYSLGGVEDPSMWRGLLEEARERGDSVGGVLRCVARGLPAGLGSPFFDGLESVLAHALFSIPGVTGVEFGMGFGASRVPGSYYNDVFVDSRGGLGSRHAGGVVGGISQGGTLELRVGVRPSSSISLEQESLNVERGEMERHSVGGRHDVCFALRGPVVVESVVQFVLADLVLRRRLDGFRLSDIREA